MKNCYLNQRLTLISWGSEKGCPQFVDSLECFFLDKKCLYFYRNFTDTDKWMCLVWFCFNVVFCGVLLFVLFSFCLFSFFSFAPTAQPGLCLITPTVTQGHVLNLQVPKLDYFKRTKSLPWLLMPWLLVSQKKPWYWLCIINRSLSSTRQDFNYLLHLKSETGLKMQIYMYIFFTKCQYLRSKYPHFVSLHLRVE